MPNATRIIDQPKVGHTKNTAISTANEHNALVVINNKKQKESYFLKSIRNNFGLICFCGGMFIFLFGIEARVAYLVLIDTESKLTYMPHIGEPILPYTLSIACLGAILSLIGSFLCFRDVFMIFIRFVILLLPTTLGAILISWFASLITLGCFHNSSEYDSYKEIWNYNELGFEASIIFSLLVISGFLFGNIGLISLWLSTAEEERPQLVVNYPQKPVAEPPPLLDNIID